LDRALSIEKGPWRRSEAVSIGLKNHVIPVIDTLGNGLQESLTTQAMPDKKVLFGEFELDFGHFQLYRNGEPVRLEGLPLQLLIYLVENQRQLVTREQIAQALWGKDVFVDIEQGINTAIRKIRIALDDDSSRPRFLQTVVGRGYRFVASCEDASAQLTFTAEELGRAVMAAAGLNPEKPKKPS
jgi:DNA-binding winged helix-turn-helix (wHTH) protein